MHFLVDYYLFIVEEHTKYFENGTRQDWHHHIKEHVLKFSEQFARQPDMKEANEMHTKIMKQVEESLKEVKIFSRLEFVGSAYEGVKVTDLEFDVMVIMKVPSLVVSFNVIFNENILIIAT